MNKPRLFKPDMVVSRNGLGIIKCHGFMTSIIIDSYTDDIKGLDCLNIRKKNFVGKTTQVAKNVGSKIFDQKKTKKYDVSKKELDDFNVESSQLPFKRCSTPVQVKPDDLEQVTAVTRVKHTKDNGFPKKEQIVTRMKHAKSRSRRMKHAKENGFPQKEQNMASEGKTSCIVAGARDLKDENKNSSSMLDLSYELLVKETENDKLLTKIKSWIENF
uniref:Uncharacterized protein n=1 Tax=Panagrolaimus sp. JU765 TaxID=591449 RepID=A0AC34RPT6_9BILA